MREARRARADLRWSFISASALAGLLLALLAPSALARDAYVVNEGANSVSVINTETNQVVGAPITVGVSPFAVAITPNGKTAYVANFDSASISVLDLQANQVVRTPITVGLEPAAIAITPDGRFVYVANYGSKNVSVINTQTNQALGAPIAVGVSPEGIGITPDGRFVYAVNQVSNSISVIDTQTNQVLGPQIKVGNNPEAISFTPDGRYAYVVNEGGENVSVIDTQTRQVTGPPIKVGSGPYGISIAPDGRSVYTANSGSKNVSVIDTQANQVLSSPITVGEDPLEVAIPPDQAPLASFTTARVRPGVAATFNASASGDPDGSIATYAWSFGDGQAASGGPSLTHVYAKPGTYQATLTLTDNEGCSTSMIFTGQTAYCNGSAAASRTQAVTVAYPGVRVSCPKSAKSRGCRFKLQAVTKKRKGKPESALAVAKLKPGHSAIVSLKPKRAFAAKLATAKKVLVKESVTIRGSTRTSYRKLKVIN
jgi:YVTN family beta-propeller protein